MLSLHAASILQKKCWGEKVKKIKNSKAHPTVADT